MTCGEYYVDASSVRLIIQNGAGTSINVTNLTVSGCGSDTSGFVVADGTEMDVTLTCSPGAVGDKFNGDITLKYLRSGKAIIETVTGDIRATIQ